MKTKENGCEKSPTDFFRDCEHNGPIEAFRMERCRNAARERRVCTDPHQQAEAKAAHVAASARKYRHPLQRVVERKP